MTPMPLARAIALAPQEQMTVRLEHDQRDELGVLVLRRGGPGTAPVPALA